MKLRISKKAVALSLAVVLSFGCGVGGTLAWLTAQTDSVENVFTTSDINIELKEHTYAVDSNSLTTEETTKGVNNYKMVPGRILPKDPWVKVSVDSEDCWLFVKITESENLDSYIQYTIADVYNNESNPNGWQIVSDQNGVTVIGREVLKSNTTKKFSILGAGEFTDTMGTLNKTEDDVKIVWMQDQVGVKPSVTVAMMEAIDGVDAEENEVESEKKPTLSFEAYAVQLYKNNTNKFTKDEAWIIAQTLK